MYLYDYLDFLALRNAEHRPIDPTDYLQEFFTNYVQEGANSPEALRTENKALTERIASLETHIVELEISIEQEKELGRLNQIFSKFELDKSVNNNNIIGSSANENTI